MHRDKEAVRSRRGASRGDPIVVEDRKRCGWGAVLAAVTLFATLLLTVPAGPATAAQAERAAVVVRHTPAGGAEAASWWSGWAGR
jgi:hypothetical protein